MNCDELSELVYDYLQDALDADRSAEFAAHMDGCGSCRGQVSEAQHAWMSLAELPMEEPGPGLRERFYATLEETRETKLDPGQSPRPPFAAWIKSLAIHPLISQGLAAGVLLVAGILIGAQMKDGEGVAELRDQVRSLSQLVTLSLLQQDSASERLRGVRFGRMTALEDDEVLTALIDAVGYDKSVNVRLAAIDALRPYLSRHAVHDSMLAFVRSEKSPLVQVSLVDALMDTDGRESRETLEAMTVDESVDESVRAHVRTRLEESA